MTEDGFLKTKDIAAVDERGILRIVDRKKYLIVTPGFNDYPTEIENVVTRHPQVIEAGCVSVLGDDGNEEVKLFVVRKSGTSLEADEIRDFCRARVAPYKVPKQVEFCIELPKSSVGKVLRRALRDG